MAMTLATYRFAGRSYRALCEIEFDLQTQAHHCLELGDDAGYLQLREELEEVRDEIRHRDLMPADEPEPF